MIEIRTIFDILWKGFIIGVVVSAPLGPVGVLCIQRTLNKGRWYGFITGLGASLSDIAYALLTGYGMSFVFDYVNKNIFYLQLFGSIMLLAFGIYTFRSNPVQSIRPISTNKGSYFHMYENKQGVYPNEKGAAYKSPGIDVPENADAVDYDTWFKKWDDLACTYIEVKGKYSIVKSQTSSSTTVDAGDINYRFFLGEDITSDFNICRNKSYIVTLDFSQEAGYGELKHEWRVHAKLDEATFLPEGDLVIDGYPQSLGYVPFYVSNGTSGSITLTTTGVSSADMNMYFNQNGYWSGSSAADFGNFKITANSLTEFAIAPNDVGILGEGRNYNQGSFSSADNLNRRDEVAKGDIYNTREYKMTFITNEETKTSVLMVKELPLLLLTNTYSPSDKSTVYARRVDGAYLHPKEVEGGYSDGSRNEYFSRTTDKIRAQRICMGTGDYQNPYAATSIGNYLKSFLPTKAEIDKIIELEKANPLKEAKYWTMDGLYDVTTKQIVSGNGEGYIRCVARPL